MGCGCGGAQQGEQWRAYLPDGTVTEPMSKAAATQEAARKGGYILEVGTPEPAKAS
jgi:hypothetical protein